MKIIFKSSSDVTQSVEAYSQLNLLAHAQLLELKVQSRCGGHCECSTCRVVLLQGTVSEMKEAERSLLVKVLQTEPTALERLACQCFPAGTEDIVVELPQHKLKDARYMK